MKRDSSHPHSRNPLSSGAEKPMSKLRFMTISGISNAGSITYTPSASRPQAQPAGDQVSMSLSPDTYSSLVSEAGQMPEVRSEVVDSFKSRIQSGDYPTQDTLDGLVDRMGGTWAANARSSSDSFSS